MARPSPDWQPACSHRFEGENFLTYSLSFYSIPPSPLIPNSKCFSLFLYLIIILVHLSVQEGEVCDGLCLYVWFLAYGVIVCVCLLVYQHVNVGCSNCCSTWSKYKRKSVDRRRRPLIAWLINQLHWLHVDPVLSSGGSAQAALWAHNNSFSPQSQGLIWPLALLW